MKFAEALRYNSTLEELNLSSKFFVFRSSPLCLACGNFSFDVLQGIISWMGVP